MHIRVIVIATLTLLLSGCGSDAEKFVNAVKNSDLKIVWEMVSDEAIDNTLVEEERKEKRKEFISNYPKSLSYGMRDIANVLKGNPDIEEIGSKQEGDNTVYAFMAIYKNGKGYVFDDTKIAKKVKFTVEQNNKTKLIIDADFDKVIQIDEVATKDNQQRRALKLWESYKKQPSDNKRNVRKILQMYSDLNTPIQELNNKIDAVKKLITAKKYDDLVKIDDTGGYSTKGREISMAEGYGMELKNYITATNLTDIPLKLKMKYDLQYLSTWETERDTWLGTRTDYHSKWYNDKENESGSLSLYSKEKDSASKSYDRTKYYVGYRVTQDNSDGTYRYRWDETRSFKANNLSLKSISIWSE